MANLVVTSTTNSVKVEFNDYYPAPLESQGGTWRKEKITFIRWPDYVEALIDGEKPWHVSYNGSGTSFQVDTINGTPPTSNMELYNLLTGLIA